MAFYYENPTLNEKFCKIHIISSEQEALVLVVLNSAWDETVIAILFKIFTTSKNDTTIPSLTNGPS